MTVMELLRSAKESTGGRGSAPDGSSWHRALLAGAGTAALSALMVVLPALLLWVVSAQSTVSWTAAAGIGASAWLLAGAAHLQVASTTLGFVPLLALAGVVAIAVISARRTARAVGTGGSARRGVPQSLVRGLVLWTAGYAGCSLLWVALAFASAAHPKVLSLLAPVFLVPLVAATAAACMALRARSIAPAWADSFRPPVTLRRALAPAAWGSLSLLATGLAIVLAAVLARFAQVSRLHHELAPGIVGGVVLVLVQILALPNLALWAISFCAGSGFSVVDGATTSWSGARSGLMPMVPVLAALPPPGAFPWVVALLVLVPVGIGALVGWRCLRVLARLSTLRTKASVMGTAVALAAAAIGLLDVAGGGSLGSGRLSHTGAPAALMTLYLVLELGLGAALVLAWDRWRLRRG